MTKDEALKLALEALELHGQQYPHMVKGYCLDAITAIKEVLAQHDSVQAKPEPEHEPVACPYCKNWATLGAVFYDQNCLGCVKRMTAPPQRTWVGLTDDEMWNAYTGGSDIINLDYAKAIETKLKEKNT